MFDQNEIDEETMTIKKEYLKNLQEFISENIQTSQEVAAVIKEAIEADKPNFRYYTSEKDLQNARAKLADTTGNAAIDFLNNTYFKGVKLSPLWKVLFFMWQGGRCKYHTGNKYSLIHK